MSAGGVVQLPWYATGFRGDALEAALQELAPLCMRHGATRYMVFRARDDRYKFLMSIEFPSKSGWDAFWFSAEFTEMRAACSGWFQVPLLYVWNDRVADGTVREPAVTADEASG